MQIIYFFVSLFSSCIGAISGIGGGIIIKPVLDLLGTVSLSTAGFLSGCTVLSMAIVSIAKAFRAKSTLMPGVTIYLAIGAAVGGVGGKTVFDLLRQAFKQDALVGVVQSALLLAINVFVYLYLQNKAKFTTRTLSGATTCLMVGLLLGVISSFLGIGGGPMNIAVLYLLFSMGAKACALNSLFIVLCSQAASLGNTLISGKIPPFDGLALLLMCAGGVLGAIIGGNLLKKMTDQGVEGFFKKVLLLISCINLWNMVKAFM